MTDLEQYLWEAEREVSDALYYAHKGGPKVPLRQIGNAICALELARKIVLSREKSQ